MDYDDDMILEKTLPEFLKNDIAAFIEGVKNKSSLLDCLYCEVQGSINSAQYGNQISKQVADCLRAKYLGL